MQIGVGNSGVVSIDIPRLVDTRMLIEANSGGGKSYLMRLIAERAGIQTIILDPEGEFASIREKLDMVLAGRDGELAANPRSAALLARRLIEFKVSAVIDLSALKLGERRSFIRQFLDSMMHLPRELWHAVIVMLDEAHLYCPERSSGDAESTESVISLMSQGRKRGFCGILATQRLSKLHKDAEAETNNVVIGRTWLDNDQKRAGDLLGMARKDAIVLRDLEPGNFYAFGPAFDGVAGVFTFRADRCETTHPKPGARHLMTAPAPSKAIESVLAKLADLPKQAEDEIRELAAAKAEIARLNREIAAKPKPAIDDNAINRAVELAVKTERHEWHQRLAEVRHHTEN